MAKRAKPIFLLDIVPGKKYLSVHPTRAQLMHVCTVECEETIGWQRGHVRVIITGMDRGFAYLQSISGSSHPADIKRPYNDYRWIFSQDNYPSLFDIPEGWLEMQIVTDQANLNEAISRHKQLMDALL